MACASSRCLTLAPTPTLTLTLPLTLTLTLPLTRCVAQMHAIAPEAHNSYPFFGERGMLHRQLASASVRTAGACKLLYISRQKFGRFLALVPDFSSRVKFVADTRVKLNRLRDQEGIDHLQRTKAMEVMEAAAATELLNLPSMRRCCSVFETDRAMPNARSSPCGHTRCFRRPPFAQCHALGPRGEFSPLGCRIERSC